MKKETSYQKLKRRLAEKDDTIRQLRADLRAIILKDGDVVRRMNVIQRVRLEKDTNDIVWYGDGTRSGRRTTGGIFELMQRKPEPVNPDLNASLNASAEFAKRHPNYTQEQFEKTVFGTDWASVGTRDESAIVAWTPEGPMTLSQMQGWIKQNMKEDAGE